MLSHQKTITKHAKYFPFCLSLSHTLASIMGHLPGLWHHILISCGTCLAKHINNALMIAYPSVSSPQSKGLRMKLVGPLSVYLAVCLAWLFVWLGCLSDLAWPSSGWVSLLPLVLGCVGACPRHVQDSSHRSVWLAGWLAGWPAGRLAGWLAGRLTGWLAGWLTVGVEGPVKTMMNGRGWCTMTFLRRLVF